MPLQIEKPDQEIQGTINIKAYKAGVPNSKKGLIGRIDSSSNIVTLSNIAASIADKHPGIHPTMIHTVARLLNEEITQQVMNGFSTEVLGLATARLGFRGGFKENLELSEKNYFTVVTRKSKTITEKLKGIKLNNIELITNPIKILSVFDILNKKDSDHISASKAIIQIKGRNIKVDGNDADSPALCFEEVGVSSPSTHAIYVKKLMTNGSSVVEVSIKEANLTAGKKYNMYIRKSFKKKDGTFGRLMNSKYFVITTID